MRYTPSPVRRIKGLIRRIVNLAIIAAVLFVAGNVLLASLRDNKTPAAPDTEIAQLLKVTLPESTPGQDIQYTGFTVNFNPEMHVPNYVAWDLTAEKVHGTIPRKNDFKADPNVAGCSTLDDYYKSGFDRGHMAPSADMKWSNDAMSDCFYLTNMCPQTSNLNSGRWNQLETKCRQWVEQDSTLIIICGPILTDRLTRTIGNSKVIVPQRFFKIIYAPYAAEPMMLAFVLSNNALPEQLKEASRSVDEIEELTGLDFFSTLPDEVENILEAKNSYGIWNSTHKPHNQKKSR